MDILEPSDSADSLPESLPDALPDAREAMLFCAYHESEPAVEVCNDCGSQICSACVSFHDRRRVCLGCATRLSRRRLFKRAAAAVGCAVMVTGIIWFYLSSRHSAPEAPAEITPPFDYGIYAARVDRQQKQLAQEPCDRRLILEHAETLLKARDYRGVVTRGERFLASCGPHSLLRWKTYAAHKNLSEWDQAIADATFLIEETPDDADFWYWRAEVYKLSGQLEQAVADYRQVLTLAPHASSSPFELSALLQRLQRPCEAVAPLELYLEHHPEDLEDPAITSRIVKLREEGACPEEPEPPAE